MLTYTVLDVLCCEFITYIFVMLFGYWFDSFLLFRCFFIFFFKQKTAYEMRISDWSSDVCSSDLERGRELGEQAGADADDDGQHQHLDARCYDIAQHLFGEEGGLVEQSEGQQHEAGQRHQVELDQGDEELHRQDEEGDEDDNPGDEQHRDLDEVGKEAAESHQIAHGVQQRFAGVEPGGGDAAGLHEIGETDPGAAGLQTETGEAVEHDAGERGEIADDEGEKADIEALRSEEQTSELQSLMRI